MASRSSVWHPDQVVRVNPSPLGSFLLGLGALLAAAVVVLVCPVGTSQGGSR